MSMENKTFKNLQVLKTTQQEVKKQLGHKYAKTVELYIALITMVMKANSINEFEALKKIKDNLSIYKKAGAPLLFSAALVEITEAKHFKELIKE